MFRRGGPSLAALAQQALTSTRGGYELLAPRFDRTPFKTPDELATRVVGRTVERIGRPARALDLCCGTGAGLRALHAVATEEVVGVDFSDAMVAVAAEAQPASPPRTQLIVADVLNAPLPARFDLITCFGALGHIAPADGPRFAGRVASALAPGGTFAFVTLRRAPRHPAVVAARAFNGVMRIRNALRRPRFVMYYLTFLLPRATELFEAEGLAVSWTPLETAFPETVIGFARKRL